MGCGIKGHLADLEFKPRPPGLVSGEIPCLALSLTRAKGTQLETAPSHTHLASLRVSRAGSQQPPDLYLLFSSPPTVHLWRFSGGYPALMDCMNKLKNNKVCRHLFHKPLWNIGSGSACAGGCYHYPMRYTARVGGSSWLPCPDCHTHRSTWSSERSGARCCCPGETRCSLNSAFGMSHSPEQAPTSMS